MLTPQSIQRHTGLTHHFLIFDIRALWRSGLSAREPECQKLKNGGLDQYGPERFGRLNLPQSEKCGTERVKTAVLKVKNNIVQLRTLCVRWAHILTWAVGRPG